MGMSGLSGRRWGRCACAWWKRRSLFSPFFGLAEARQHARIRAVLRAQGTTIGPHDYLIAATALSVGFAVASLNRREFERVPGLTLTDVTDFLSPPA